MKKFLLTAMCSSIGFFMLTPAAQAQAIKDGEWTMNITTKMEGMGGEAAEAMAAMESMSPEEKALMQQMMGGMNVFAGASGAGISMTRNDCINQEEPVPPMEGQEDCLQTHSINGNTVKFETTCENSSSSGQITYNEDMMEGSIISHDTSGGEETITTIEISGQYVGPCADS